MILSLAYLQAAAPITPVSSSVTDGAVRFIQSQGLDGCSADEDCVRVKAGCCGCEAGGEDKAINKKFLSDYNDRLSASCDSASCSAPSRCTAVTPRCNDGLCRLE